MFISHGLRCSSVVILECYFARFFGRVFIILLLLFGSFLSYASGDIEPQEAAFLLGHDSVTSFQRWDSLSSEERSEIDDRIDTYLRALETTSIGLKRADLNAQDLRMAWTDPIAFDRSVTTLANSLDELNRAAFIAGFVGANIMQNQYRASVDNLTEILCYFAREALLSGYTDCYSDPTQFVNGLLNELR